MAWLIILIRTYFVLVLAISGLAKLRAPMAFEQTLAKQGVIPAPARALTARAVPAAEIVLAILLVGGILPVFTEGAVLATFVAFATLEAYLVVTHKATECGCYGVAFPQRVDGASIATSAVQVSLAVGLLIAALTGVGAIGSAASLALVLGAAALVWLAPALSTWIAMRVRTLATLRSTADDHVAHEDVRTPTGIRRADEPGRVRALRVHGAQSRPERTS